MMMENMHTSTFARPVAFLAEESGYLRELAHTGYGVQHKLLRYSNNFGLDWEKLDAAMAGVEEVAVILTASSSSDLWLHKEHGPVTRKLCEHLRSKHGGLTLRFVVRPTTTDAKKRWNPSTSHTGVFHEFVKDNDPPVLIWRAEERPQSGHAAQGWNQHTGISICELAVQEEAASRPERAPQCASCGCCLKGSFILLVLMAILIIIATIAGLREEVLIERRSKTTLQEEVNLKESELNQTRSELNKTRQKFVALKETASNTSKELHEAKEEVSNNKKELRRAKEEILALNGTVDSHKGPSESARPAAVGGEVQPDVAQHDGLQHLSRVTDHRKLDEEEWFPPWRNASEFGWVVPLKRVHGA